MLQKEKKKKKKKSKRKKKIQGHIKLYLLFSFLNPLLLLLTKWKNLCNHGLVESLGGATSTSVDRKLHLRDLLVDIFHELNDEIDKLALVKSLSMNVGDKETDIISDLLTIVKNLNDRLATKHKEVISTLSEEAHETLCKDGIELIELLKANANANAVH